MFSEFSGELDFQRIALASHLQFLKPDPDGRTAFNLRKVTLKPTAKKLQTDE